MSDLFSTLNPGTIFALFSVIGLATLSLVLLWEGFRRWARGRSASQAMQRIARQAPAEKGGASARETSLLRDRDVPRPAWIESLYLFFPHKEDIQRLLDQAGVRWDVGSLLLGCMGLGFALGAVAWTATRGPLFPAVAAGIGTYLPVLYLKIKRSRRFRAFEAHFPEAIDLLARAARAGHALPMGLQVVGEEAEEPIATEFRQVHEEQRFGLPLKESLLALADRVDLVDVRIFVTAVLIQRESGGNLAENLDTLAAVIRSRFRFKRDVLVKSAHGRMTGFVVGLAPLVAGLLMYALNPEYMTPLLVEPAGRIMLLVGGTMMLLGFLVIRRMVEIKF